MDSAHCLGCSTSASERTFLAHLLLAKRNTHVGEEVGKNNRRDTTSADGFLGLVESGENIGNALQDGHLGSIDSKTGEVLGSPKSSGKNDSLESQYSSRREQIRTS